MSSGLDRTLSRNTFIAYGVTVLLVFAASFFPEQRLWGLHWYSYYDWYVPLLMGLVGLIVPLVILGVARPEESEIGVSARKKNYYPLIVLFLLLLCLLAFYLLRARTHFLGDGYQLLTWLQKSIHFKPWEKGAFAVQSWVFGILGGGATDALPALQLVSYLCGLLFLAAVSIAASRLFTRTDDRLLFLLGVGSGGYMLLFFGYLESYPLFVLAVGLFCLVGMLAVRGLARRWLILLPLALAAFFHIFAVVLIPGAMYVLLRGTASANRWTSLGRSIRIVIPLAGLVVGGAIFFYFYTTSYFFRFTIVPLVKDQHTVDGYWMFSGAHLLDYVNLVFQLLPAVLIMVALLFDRYVRQRLLQSENLFLGLTVVMSLGLVFVINPGLGMPRDWDLFSFAGVPMALLFYHLVISSDAVHKRGIATLGVVLGLLILAPRVGTQVDPAKGIAVFDRAAALDRAKNSSGRFILREYLAKQGRHDEAERRRRVDNVILPEGEWVKSARDMILDGRADAGVLLLRKALASDPSHHMAWANLGAAFAGIGELDSALLYLTIASARMPYNPGIYTNLGGVYFARQEFEAAEQFWLDASELNPLDFTPGRRLLFLYNDRSHSEKQRSLLLKMARADDAPPDILSEAASLKLDENDPATAAHWLGLALERGLDSAHVCDLQRTYPRLELIDCED